MPIKLTAHRNVRICAPHSCQFITPVPRREITRSRDQIILKKKIKIYINCTISCWKYAAVFSLFFKKKRNKQNKNIDQNQTGYLIGQFAMLKWCLALYALLLGRIFQTEPVEQLMPVCYPCRPSFLDTFLEIKRLYDCWVGFVMAELSVFHSFFFGES